LQKNFINSREHRGQVQILVLMQLPELAMLPLLLIHQLQVVLIKALQMMLIMKFMTTNNL